MRAPTPAARPNYLRLWLAVPVVILAATLSACNGNGDDVSCAKGVVMPNASPACAPAAADPPEVVIGERLFLETRFAQFFAVNFSGDVNKPLPAGDPALDITATTTGGFVGPFAGKTMNCRQCHFVDDAVEFPGGRSLSYGDFAQRSPIPARSDGATTAPRNSPPLVNASLARTNGFLLHFDGEFASAADLVRGTFSGRNFGWLPGERAAAVAHIAKVIREDDGTDEFAADTGGLSYSMLFSGVAAVPAEFRLPPSLRIDVANASDEAIFDAVAEVVANYVTSLEFSRDANGDFNGSPFDKFLEKNALPRHPNAGESDLDYQRRLRGLIVGLAAPVFVTPADGELLLHDGQVFEFGAVELQGLRVFLAEPSSSSPSSSELAAGGIGNCLACHQGPQFTDFLAHNVATAQEEFDFVHGAGSFMTLPVPDLTARSADEDTFLPATEAHPSRLGVFKRVPSSGDPLATDLGIWNFFANSDAPNPQAALREVVATVHGLDPLAAPAAQLLDLSVGMFKTPGLRSLGQGAPYFHTGRFDALSDVVSHYRTFAESARSGLVRNADPRLSGIALIAADDAPLVAFLRSLNEDYQ